MKIGFTGTRKGMSAAQKDQLDWLLGVFAFAAVAIEIEFHHGGAVGADEQAAEMFGLYTAFSRVVSHPAGTDPLARNRIIVSLCDVLIAAPETDKEQLRSGTWATVRYARQARKPVIMLSRGKE